MFLYVMCGKHLSNHVLVQDHWGHLITKYKLHSSANRTDRIKIPRDAVSVHYLVHEPIVIQEQMLTSCRYKHTSTLTTLPHTHVHTGFKIKAMSFLKPRKLLMLHVEWGHERVRECKCEESVRGDGAL